MAGDNLQSFHYLKKYKKINKNWSPQAKETLEILLGLTVLCREYQILVDNLGVTQIGLQSMWTRIFFNSKLDP